MPGRATSPALGIVCLLVVTAVLAGVVGTAALGTSVPDAPPTVAVDLQADADANRLTLVHRGGDVLDVRDLSILVRVDDTALDAQPPVPFFSAEGFRPGPTGPFNSASDPHWEAGERASVALAETNDPTLAPGARVAVKITASGSVVAEVETTA